ncbi:hypothetical protein HDU98_011237 [Podochytrium sp. JEL0797]|nr:hypothetical protein HDU98_011237 [Podochytrium sp. JEL0797]
MRLDTIQSLLAVLLAATQVSAFDWTLLGKGNSYTSLTTTLTVPPVPARPATGDATYFYWPGLQTNTAATNYNPIGFGVLQPVLTFGPACTPNQPQGVSVYRGWHISAQYVNPTGTVAGHKGCLGGNMMDVQPGDNLLMTMVLQGTVWVQTVTRQGVACSGPGNGVNGASGCQVTYSIDMQGQAQNRAELVLELYYQAVVTSPVTFSGISMTILNAEPSTSTRFCTSTSRLQTGETCSGMSLSADGKTCTIQQCFFAASASPVTPPPVSAGSGADANGTPIAPSNVVPPQAPPPPDDTPSDGSTTGDAATAGVAQATGNSDQTAGNIPPANGGSINVNANNAPSTGGSSPSNTTTTPPAKSNTLLYGGAAAGAFVVLAIGAFAYSRKRSSSQSASEAVNIHKYAEQAPKPIDRHTPPLPSDAHIAKEYVSTASEATYVLPTESTNRLSVIDAAGIATGRISVIDTSGSANGRSRRGSAIVRDGSQTRAQTPQTGSGTSRNVSQTRVATDRSDSQTRAQTPQVSGTGRNASQTREVAPLRSPSQASRVVTPSGNSRYHEDEQDDDVAVSSANIRRPRTAETDDQDEDVAPSSASSRHRHHGDQDEVVAASNNSRRPRTAETSSISSSTRRPRTENSRERMRSRPSRVDMDHSSNARDDSHSPVREERGRRANSSGTRQVHDRSNSRG